MLWWLVKKLLFFKSKNSKFTSALPAPYLSSRTQKQFIFALQKFNHIQDKNAEKSQPKALYCCVDKNAGSGLKLNQCTTHTAVEK
jgi:hypothetical protein